MKEIQSSLSICERLIPGELRIVKSADGLVPYKNIFSYNKPMHSLQCTLNHKYKISYKT